MIIINQLNNSVQLIQRIFVKKNVPKSPEETFFFPEIAIFIQIGLSKLPKYSRILKFSYFPLGPVAKFG
jgi:hypothetical protein